MTEQFSVLCIGRILDSPVSTWKENIDWYIYSLQCGELDRVDGEPMEFEWKFSQDSLYCRFSSRSTT